MWHETSAAGWQVGRYVCGLVSGCCPGRRLVGTSGWAAGDDSTESHMDVCNSVMRVSIICHCAIILWGQGNLICRVLLCDHFFLVKKWQQLKGLQDPLFRLQTELQKACILLSIEDCGFKKDSSTEKFLVLKCKTRESLPLESHKLKVAHKPHSV